MQKITVEKNKENPYVMLNKKPLDDTRLSWKAKGVWAYLLSKPDGWSVRPKDIENRSKDGRESVAGALNELEQFGYIVRTQLKEKGKFAGFSYSIFEEPLEEQPAKPKRVRNKKPQTEKPSTVNNVKPQTGKPLTVKPQTEKPSHSNKRALPCTKTIINETTTEAPVIVVAPILKKNTDGELAPDIILPNGITQQLLVNLAIKYVPLHGADIVDRQMINLKTELSRREIHNSAGWLRSACRDNYPSVENISLFDAEKAKKSEELVRKMLAISESESMAGSAPIKTHEEGLALAAGFLNRIGREVSLN